MSSITGPINITSTFVTFFAVVGPPKVMLTFAHVARGRTAAEARRVALLASAASALLGALCAWTAPYMAEFFHISPESLELAGGIIFFLYAVGLVLGMHLGADTPEEADEMHPLVSGFRELLLPYVVSPLAVTAVLVESLDREGWAWRSSVVGSFVAVAAINAVCMVATTGLLRKVHTTTLELCSRLLGLLLAAVGVELFLTGLDDAIRSWGHLSQH
ncbi:MarC family protein [Streptacidiphilus rugosus]|uniref:MarC family protein n=1 Tax=Streptacidiphilus rugosus TaxID=405783 RepID=UPI00055CAD31|nr:MarC family protein [Streptacidiphilus rugosus]